MSLEQMVQHDWLQAVRDWGQAVVYRRIQNCWDTSDHVAEETVTEYPLRGLVSPLQASPQPGTAGQAVAAQMQFVLRQLELPAEAPRLTDQLQWNGQRWQITLFEAAAVTGWLRVQAVRVQEEV